MGNPEVGVHPDYETMAPPPLRHGAGIIDDAAELASTQMASGDWRQALTEAGHLASALAAGTMLTEVIDACKKEPDVYACSDHLSSKFYEVTQRADLQLDDYQHYMQAVLKDNPAFKTAYERRELVIQDMNEATSGLSTDEKRTAQALIAARRDTVNGSVERAQVDGRLSNIAQGPERPDGLLGIVKRMDSTVYSADSLAYSALLLPVIDAGGDVTAAHHAYATLMALTGHSAIANDQDAKALRPLLPAE